MHTLLNPICSFLNMCSTTLWSVSEQCICEEPKVIHITLLKSYVLNTKN
jgi:hypothetical protein